MKYAVAYLSLFVGELKIDFVEAESELAATRLYLAKEGWKWGYDTVSTVEELYGIVFDCDCWIRATLVTDSM